MDVEIFSEKNIKSRTIVWDQTLVNKGLNFAGNDGETPVAPQVAVYEFNESRLCKRI